MRAVSNRGLRLAVHEWGDEAAPPLLLAHGGFDFAGTYDVFAPLLAAAGWRVVCWDQRGHGDSDHAVVYSWESDVRDALAVLDATTREPVPFVGHSKGGSLVLQLADAFPHRCLSVVNLDGLPSRRNQPDVADHERTRLIAGELAGWLDHRAATVGKERRPGTLDELAHRRQRMNPRLAIEWLRYLVTVGARCDDDGWRWKLDPTLRMGGFGPWRPEWSMMRIANLAMPVLGVLAGEPEQMGWGTRPEDVSPVLPAHGEVMLLDGVGHFLHIEQPDRIAKLVLDFIGAPPSRASWGPVTAGTPAPRGAERAAPKGREVTRFVVHNRARLALHELRRSAGRPLLHVHGLGEHSPSAVPTGLEAWPGPVHALDLTGHGDSTIPLGGGYSAEILMADVDAAVRVLGDEVTLFGRGLGAYIALLLAGARPEAVRGAILADGSGLQGAGNGPGSPMVATVDGDAVAPPDPFAIAELSRDIRPADYASTFARLAIQAGAVEHPILVTGANRPDWLEAVISEPGVVEVALADAIAMSAG